MKPAGLKFGLSHNLLALNGTGAVIAPKALDCMSEMARRLMLNGVPLFGTDFGDRIMGDGIAHLVQPHLLR